MSRRYSSEHQILPDSSRATEHSVPFSDLRVNADIRHMRLWLRGEVHDNIWLPVDIARGGLSVLSKLRSVEHSDSARNKDLLQRVAVSAFTLYQDDKLTDKDGNLVAFALPRNAFLQLGQIPGGHFDALRGESLARNHVALTVDDNDTLGIEAHDLDNLPQVEVIKADGDTAVASGNVRRNYMTAPDIGTGYITRSERPVFLEPLSATYGFVRQRPTTAVHPESSRDISHHS